MQIASALALWLPGVKSSNADCCTCGPCCYMGRYIGVYAPQTSYAVCSAHDACTCIQLPACWVLLQPAVLGIGAGRVAVSSSRANAQHVTRCLRKWQKQVQRCIPRENPTKLQLLQSGPLWTCTQQPHRTNSDRTMHSTAASTCGKRHPCCLRRALAHPAGPSACTPCRHPPPTWPGR